MGAICGLGPDLEGRAIYPDHDMEVTFDVTIDDRDILDVRLFSFIFLYFRSSYRYETSINVS